MVFGGLASAGIQLLSSVINAHDSVIRAGGKSAVGEGKICFAMTTGPSVIEIGSRTVVVVMKRKDLSAIAFKVRIDARVIARDVAAASETIDALVVVGITGRG